MSHTKLRVRKHLNADALFELVHTESEKIPDLCERPVEISVADALKSGFAMFSLKDPSLLAFDRRRKDPSKVTNLKRVFHLKTVPCDTQMREIADPVDPDTHFCGGRLGGVEAGVEFLDLLLSLDQEVAGPGNAAV